MTRAEGACHYCGKPATSIDHIVPMAYGGSDVLSNMTSACRSCNSRKRDNWPSCECSDCEDARYAALSGPRGGRIRREIARRIEMKERRVIQQRGELERAEEALTALYAAADQASRVLFVPEGV